MPKVQVEADVIKKIIELRRTGHSLPEIRKATGKGNSTVFKYIKNVKVLQKYSSILKAKQGGSIERAKRDWLQASQHARDLIGHLTERDKLFILACLYWGEGTKKYDLNLNNSDPSLIKVFVECLKVIGVRNEDLRITLRIYEDMDRSKVINFWSKLLSLPKEKILGINILTGKKEGKLKYGMCRVRVTKGAAHFKLIMSMIDLIKSDFNAAIVQWIEQRSPNARM